MKNIMKLVALVLALALLPVSAFATEFNAPGEYPICKETVKLTVGIPDNIRIEDYETNVMTQKLEEYGNFDLDFVIYDSTDYTTKINLMMMAGGSELPDIILFDNNAGTKVTDNQLYSWAQTGSIIPLTQYYNDPSISYWLHEAVERTGVDFTLFPFTISPTAMSILARCTITSLGWRSSARKCPLRWMNTAIF